MHNKRRGGHWSSKYYQTSCFARSCLYLVQYSSIISTEVLFLKDTKTYLTNTYIWNILFSKATLSWMQLIFFYPVYLVSDAKYAKNDHCVNIVHRTAMIKNWISGVLFNHCLFSVTYRKTLAVFQRWGKTDLLNEDANERLINLAMDGAILRITDGCGILLLTKRIRCFQPLC